jgi:hypothetical protein
LRKSLDPFGLFRRALSVQNHLNDFRLCLSLTDGSHSIYFEGTSNNDDFFVGLIAGAAGR